MNKETFTRLFLFNKTFENERRDTEITPSFEDWEVEWDTEVKDQLVNLKKELSLLDQAEKSIDPYRA